MDKDTRARLENEQEGMKVSKPEDAQDAITMARLHQERMVKEAKKRLVEASKDQAEG